MHASFALREEGYETIMLNCNPETVSTDYDTSDRLYFEPLTLEDAMNVIEAERPEGVIVQFGGQTPLKLAIALEEAEVKILGTSPDSIDLAEDRKRFGALLEKLRIDRPPFGTATSVKEALQIARKIGFPLLVRPSYVLGGRAMEIVYTERMLEKYMRSAVTASPGHPVLIDSFLEGAVEIDVDAVCDGEDVVIGAIMEHIEETGIHSGDSACAIPAFSLDADNMEKIKDYTKRLAKALHVIGLINIQYAVKNRKVYVIEVNPRASRTIPFVSKSSGIPFAKLAAKAMVGVKLSDMGFKESLMPTHIAIKEAVLPFNRFPEVDTVLGPEMKSTGEVMGIDQTFGWSFAKAQLAAGQGLPIGGKVFVSVCDKDKQAIAPIAKKMVEMGIEIIATKGTAKFLVTSGINVRQILKVKEGRPNAVDLIKSAKIDLVINIPWGRNTRDDEYHIRTAAAARGVPCITTISGALAAIQGIEALRDGNMAVKCIQEHHKR